MKLTIPAEVVESDEQGLTVRVQTADGESTLLRVKQGDGLPAIEKRIEGTRYEERGPAVTKRSK